MRKTAFVKISGDLISSENVLNWLKQTGKDYFVVVCVGGGTKINEEFEKRNILIKFGPLGREIENFSDRQLARDILEKNQVEIQNLFRNHKIEAEVVIPVLDIGSVLCHINGDVYIKMAYLGFDKLFILTLADRLNKKKEEFKDYPKIEVLGF